MVWRITDSQRLSSRTERDDHNNPALLRLSGQRVLAAYARRGQDAEWFSRIGEFDPGRVACAGRKNQPSIAPVLYASLCGPKRVIMVGGELPDIYRLPYPRALVA